MSGHVNIPRTYDTAFKVYDGPRNMQQLHLDASIKSTRRNIFKCYVKLNSPVSIATSCILEQSP